MLSLIRRQHGRHERRHLWLPLIASLRREFARWRLQHRIG